MHSVERIGLPNASTVGRNTLRTGGTHNFDLDRLLSHADPGPEEQSEAYVRLMYEQNRIDVFSERVSAAG